MNNEMYKEDLFKELSKYLKFSPKVKEHFFNTVSTKETSRGDY